MDVKELLPPGLTLQQLLTSQGACVDSICQLGEVPVSQTVIITAVTKVNPDVALGTVLTNTAVVFTDTSDPNLTNNKDETSLMVGTVVDLSIRKQAVITTIVVGDTAEFRIIVTNHGPAVANRVIVTDQLPAGLTYVGAGGSATCGAIGTGTIVCDLGRMASGEEKTISIFALAGDNAVGERTNTVVVAAPGTRDPNPANNTATAKIVVKTRPTAITVSSFSVAGLSDRLVITWGTATEPGIIGFYVWRSMSQNRAEAVRIRDLPAKGIDGATYVIEDLDVDAGVRYWYWIEEIPFHGEFGLVWPGYRPG